MVICFLLDFWPPAWDSGKFRDISERRLCSKHAQGLQTQAEVPGLQEGRTSTGNKNRRLSTRSKCGSCS